MKSETEKLSVVKESTKEEHHAKRAAVNRQWDETEKSWRITQEEVVQRVESVRRWLEKRQRGLEGAPFDMFADNTPCFLYDSVDKLTSDLVEDLNPLIEKYFESINTFAEEHGTHEFLDFESKLLSLKSEAANSGFKVGVLAGAIFSGCSEETIDRFERGLAITMQTNPHLIK